MIVNVPLNAIGEERPHVPQPRPAYNQGSYIACARGAKFNFVLFVHVKSSSRPCPRAATALRPPRLHRDGATRSEGAKRAGDAGVEEISPALSWSVGVA